MSRTKISKERLLRIAERAGTSIEFHPQSPSWAKEPDDTNWRRWIQLYYRLDSRIRQAKKDRSREWILSTKKTQTVFGKFLREERKRKKMTLAKLSVASGVSAGQISRIETGQRRAPRRETIWKLSKGLDMEYELLMKAAGYLDMGEGATNEPTSANREQDAAGISH